MHLQQVGASPTSVNCFLDWDAADGWWANGLFYGTVGPLLSDDGTNGLLV
jgi:hypothetical protein